MPQKRLSAPRQQGLTLIALCTLVLLWAGCDTQIEPIGEDADPFTLFGFLNPLADTQAVRVIPIMGEVESTGARLLDATVRSRDVETGEERVWQDSLRQEATGGVRHVFWSAFRAEFGHTYRLEVVRSDGALSRVVVTVPPRITLSPGTPILEAGPFYYPVEVIGQAPRLNQIEGVYETTALPLSGANTGITPPADTIRLAQDRPQERTTTGWSLILDLRADAERVREIYRKRGVPEGDRLRIHRVNLDLFVANEAWNPPGGLFDPERLVQPGTLSNVEGGLGFVGAGYPVSASLPFPEDALTFYSNKFDFMTASPELITVDFEESAGRAFTPRFCPPVLNAESDNSCFEPGDLPPGLEIRANPVTATAQLLLPRPDPITFVNQGLLPSFMIQTADQPSTLDVVFPEGNVKRVGMDLYLAPLPNTIVVTVYGPKEALLGVVFVAGDLFGRFLGMVSEKPITRINLATSNLDQEAWEAVDNITFGAE